MIRGTDVPAHTHTHTRLSARTHVRVLCQSGHFYIQGHLCSGLFQACIILRPEMISVQVCQCKRFVSILCLSLINYAFQGCRVKAQGFLKVMCNQKHLFAKAVPVDFNLTPLTFKMNLTHSCRPYAQSVSVSHRRPMLREQTAIK